MKIVTPKVYVTKKKKKKIVRAKFNKPALLFCLLMSYVYYH